MESTSMIDQRLVIRQATRADLPFAAWCSYEASSPQPGFCYWDPLLEGTGTPAPAFLEAVFAADALAWGRCEDFTIVEDAGRPVGGASGFVMDAHDFRPLRLDRLPDVARRLGWSAAALAQFQHGYMAVWSDPRDPTLAPSASWTIECVAVAPAARGRGVAKELVRAVLDRGRRGGHTHAGIAVTVGNEPARRAYESVGFELYIAYGAAYFDGMYPGTLKYRLPLAGRAA